MGILATVLTPVISATGGIFVWAWLSSWRERRRLMRAFVEKQVTEFYSPLLDIKNQVSAACARRERGAAAAVWAELYDEASERGRPGVRQRLSAERSTIIAAVVHDKDDQWKRELLPCYRAMLDIFQEKIWLAEATTREQFKTLTTYVELWERGLNRAIPVEIIAGRNIPEADLAPLYEDLEQTFRNLCAKLA